jgi:DNA polymerase-1
LQGDRIYFHFVEDKDDAKRAVNWTRQFIGQDLGMDTESTGLDCYLPDWRLRTFQLGNDIRSFILPAKFRAAITKIWSFDINWIGYNGPHDVRCVDAYLGYESKVVIEQEAYITAHHSEPRKSTEGGVDLGLKEQCIAHVDPSAGKWEVALKQSFKQITVPIPGEVYKSGPRKGQPKMRKALMSEGWALQDIRHPAYIAYAGADPILAYRLWRFNRNAYSRANGLYERDLKIDLICDRLQRRGMPVDERYLKRYRAALNKRAAHFLELAAELGCTNINSGQQIAATLIELGAQLKYRTPKGKWQTDNTVLESLLHDENRDVRRLVRYILTARRLTKRAEVYAAGMLRMMDSEGRVHPSINSLAARTGRMSAGIFQQLPTKDQD